MSSAPWDLSAFVQGVPVTKGSTRPVPIRNKAGRIVKIATVASNAGRQDTWAGYVAQAFRDVVDESYPYAGPVEVVCHFVLSNNRSGSRTPITTGAGDLDKLTRCVWDALTGIVYVDDVQVVTDSNAKRTAQPGEATGAQIYVRLLDVEAGGTAPHVVR